MAAWLLGTKEERGCNPPKKRLHRTPPPGDSLVLPNKEKKRKKKDSRRTDNSLCPLGKNCYQAHSSQNEKSGANAPILISPLSSLTLHQPLPPPSKAHKFGVPRSPDSPPFRGDPCRRQASPLSLPAAVTLVFSSHFGCSGASGFSPLSSL